MKTKFSKLDQQINEKKFIHYKKREIVQLFKNKPDKELFIIKICLQYFDLKSENNLINY